MVVVVGESGNEGWCEEMEGSGVVQPSMKAKNSFHRTVGVRVGVGRRRRGGGGFPIVCGECYSIGTRDG